MLHHHTNAQLYSLTFPGASPSPVCSVLNICLQPDFLPPLSLGLFLLLIAHRSVIFGGPLMALPPELAAGFTHKHLPASLHRTLFNIHLIFHLHISPHSISFFNFPYPLLPALSLVICTFVCLIGLSSQKGFKQDD